MGYAKPEESLEEALERQRRERQYYRPKHEPGYGYVYPLIIFGGLITAGFVIWFLVAG